MKLRKCLILTSVALSLLMGHGASAMPQGEWPEEMRGQTLPPQDWIMLLPAQREPDGSIVVWDKDSQWNRLWLVPNKTKSGMRVVTVNGDSDDKRTIDADDIDLMHVSSLSVLASKYQASAIAVVVIDDHQEVAVAAWSKGRYATWDVVYRDGSNESLIEDTLSTIDSIFSENNEESLNSEAGLTAQ